MQIVFIGMSRESLLKSRKKKLLTKYRSIDPDQMKEPVFLSFDQWESLKWQYISGGLTFEILARKFGVSAATIRNKSCKEKWAAQKKEFEAKVAQKKQETNEEILASLGMPKVRLLQLMTEAAEGGADIHKLANVKELIDYQVVRKGKGKNAVEMKVPIILETTQEVRDNDLIMRYRQELHKLIGSYAPPKSTVKVETDMGEKPKVEIYIPDNKRPLIEDE